MVLRVQNHYGSSLLAIQYQEHHSRKGQILLISCKHFSGWCYHFSSLNYFFIIIISIVKISSIINIVFFVSAYFCFFGILIKSIDMNQVSLKIYLRILVVLVILLWHQYCFHPILLSPQPSLILYTNNHCNHCLLSECHSPHNEVVEGIMFLTGPSVSQSVSPSVSPSVRPSVSHHYLVTTVQPSFLDQS